MTESVFSPRYRAMSVGVLMSVTVVAFQALGVGTVMPAVASELDGLDATAGRSARSCSRA